MDLSPLSPSNFLLVPVVGRTQPDARECVNKQTSSKQGREGQVVDLEKHKIISKRCGVCTRCVQKMGRCEALVEFREQEESPVWDGLNT